MELVDSDPEIWRQLEIRSTMTLDQVHRVLQTAFGWEDMHLHRYTALEPFVRLRAVHGEIPDDLQWLPKQECLDPDDRPEEDLSLEQLFALGSAVAFYEYDFGDSWLHRLELVSRRPADEGAPPARLLDGATRPARRLGRVAGVRGHHGRLGRSVSS
ncbi:plasmid pRiA4b ORF-3 family protein [Pseudarthrobacter sp. H3Y2-7]|uniref:plasmid pRiA4b ORF-3 family protein n=1 Tax=Pseudarthrobacter naphthalenicus TaxID=3031328 RepID=UPI0023AECA68|nr:plasmid pRiA4b ORF-3 family protein [Pseudarthrobacter sp. H3Y2-7]MDE8670517.1 plasmid pRiA4b ORF-3 family protein [Pseudarthrobacter sp. H3Y2-7]